MAEHQLAHLAQQIDIALKQLQTHYDAIGNTSHISNAFDLTAFLTKYPSTTSPAIQAWSDAQVSLQHQQLADKLLAIIDQCQSSLSATRSSWVVDLRNRLLACQAIATRLQYDLPAVYTPFNHSHTHNVSSTATPGPCN
jgi:hypothetical protein